MGVPQIVNIEALKLLQNIDGENFDNAVLIRQIHQKFSPSQLLHHTALVVQAIMIIVIYIKCL